MLGDVHLMVDLGDVEVRLGAIEDNQGEILVALDKISDRLGTLNRRSTRMATDLTALTAEVQEVSDVQQSAILLIEGLAQAVRDAGTDPVALAALADQLDQSTTALAAAVAAGQPAPVPNPDEPPAA